MIAKNVHRIFFIFSISIITLFFCISLLINTVNVSIKSKYNERIIRGPNCSENNFRPLRFEAFSYSHWNQDQDNFLLTRALTLKEHSTLMDLVNIAGTIMANLKFEYFIADGSLLGSVRHWDCIPWDDDFDIITDFQNLPELKSYLRTQNQWNNLNWTIHANSLKLFFKDSQKAGEKNWRFPFLDIFFYEKNSTHICYLSDSMCSLNSHVFPLKYRPMGLYWLPTPNSPIEYLESKGINDIHENCVKTPYNHRNENFPSFVDLNYKCGVLKHLYPFTSSTCNTTHCIETLRLASRDIARIVLEK